MLQLVCDFNSIMQALVFLQGIFLVVWASYSKRHKAKTSTSQETRTETPNQSHKIGCTTTPYGFTGYSDVRVPSYRKRDQLKRDLDFLKSLIQSSNMKMSPKQSKWFCDICSRIEKI